MNPSSYIPLSADHTTTPEKFSGLKTPLAWLAVDCEPEEPIQHDGKRVHGRLPATPIEREPHE